MEKAVKDGSIKKKKMKELKDFLKENKINGSGTQPQLIQRITLYVKSRGMQIEGQDPMYFKAAELRKQASKRGINPMQEPDEMLKELIESELGGGKGAGAVGTGEAKIDSNDSEGVKLAKQVLALDDDFNGILSLLGNKISSASSPSDMRKAYLLISRQIHPDKIGREFPMATKAFQLLVSAYEGLSQPDMTKASTAKATGKTLSRSNEGCYRTKVCCPRCGVEWGQAIDGLEDAAYSHLMMGIKTYCCSTCLLSFGCMTAVHKCPFCRKSFDYSPDDFHRHISCGNSGCSRTFGFMLINVSETRMKELREEVKAAQEKRLKRQDAIDRRNARAQVNTGGPVSVEGESAALAEEVKAFKSGLLDACPRCGHEMGARDGADEAQEHLRSCKDAKKIAAYLRKKKVAAGVAAQKKERERMQDNVVGTSTWRFLGAENENLWMLSVEALRKQCADYKIDVTGEKDQLIVRLVRHRNALDSSRMLGNAEGDGSEGRAGQKAKASMPSHHTLPKNLEELDLAQLKAVAASHGIEWSGGAQATRRNVIDAIERERFRDEPQLRLTMSEENKAADEIRRKTKGSSKPAAKRAALDSDSDEDTPLVARKRTKANADGDSDYDPDA